MDKVIEGFLQRNLPKLKDEIDITLTGEIKDYYIVHTNDNKVY